MAKHKIKEVIESLGELKDERKRKLQALSIVQHREQTSGKKFPNSIKRQCDEWAQDVLGWKGYAPWLYVYASVAGEFKEGWIPDNYYGKVVLPAINGSSRLLAPIKTLSKRLFDSEYFPDIAYSINGRLVTSTYEPLSRKSMKSWIFADGREKVIFKCESSRQGKGVAIFTKDTFSIDSIMEMGNGVFQNYIVQHPLFSEISPQSVASLRITTILDASGKSEVRAAYLRVGSGSDTIVKSASHIRIPIQKKTGQFSEIGYTTKWIEIDRHPDSNFVFANRQIPCYEDCINITTSLHAQFPYAQCIGWDVVVDSMNHVSIMEWNAHHNDIKFSEAVNGPCFADLGWEKLWKTK